MPRIPKSPMQLYREKLAKALEKRMPFMEAKRRAREEYLDNIEWYQD